MTELNERELLRQAEQDHAAEIDPLDDLADAFMATQEEFDAEIEAMIDAEIDRMIESGRA